MVFVLLQIPCTLERHHKKHEKIELYNLALGFKTAYVQ